MATEFEIKGVLYRAGKLDAFAQLHVSRKIAPVLPKLFPVLARLQVGATGLGTDLDQLAEVLGPLADAMASMPKDDVDLVVSACLGVVSRKQGDALYSPIWRNGVIMFEDIDLAVMLPIVVNVVRDSLGNFISGLLSSGGASPVV